MFVNRWRQKWKKVLSIGVLFIGILVPTVNCMAADTGTLRIEYHGRTEENENIVLSGAEFSLYYVGAMENGDWKLSQEFQKSGVSLEKQEASERKRQAIELYQYALEQKLSNSIQKTDAAGVAQFGDLGTGLYLVVQTEELQNQTGTFSSVPFLISVPIEENGILTWNVVTEPKSEWIRNKVEPETPTTDKKPIKPEMPTTDKKPIKPETLTTDKKLEKVDGVKTGDTTPIEFMTIVLFISAGMIGMIGIRGKRIRKVGKNV